MRGSHQTTPTRWSLWLQIVKCCAYLLNVFLCLTQVLHNWNCCTAKSKTMCKKQLPRTNHCLQISSIVTSHWRQTGSTMWSLLPTFYLLSPHVRNAGLDLLLLLLLPVYSFKPVPYLPLVCASVFDGLWLSESQSLINWWVWLSGLFRGCKPSAFHSNRQPYLRASLCLQLLQNFSDVPCWWFSGNEFVCCAQQ